MIPVKVLVENGLTILGDLHQFGNQVSGAKIIKDNAHLVTLLSPSQVLWIPYGMYPVAIAREPEGEIKEAFSSIWGENGLPP